MCVYVCVTEREDREREKKKQTSKETNKERERERETERQYAHHRRAASPPPSLPSEQSIETLTHMDNCQKARILLQIFTLILVGRDANNNDRDNDDY